MLPKCNKKKKDNRDKSRPQSKHSFYQDNDVSLSASGSIYSLPHSNSSIVGQFRGVGRGAYVGGRGANVGGRGANVGGRGANVGGRGAASVGGSGTSGSLIHSNQQSNYSSNYSRTMPVFNYQDSYRSLQRRNDIGPGFQRPHFVSGDRPSYAYSDRPSFAYNPINPAVKRFNKPVVVQKFDSKIEGRPGWDPLELVQFTVYFCPQCGHEYNFRYQQNNRHLGRIPLILQCSHTMCQECIYQVLHNSKVSCHTCAKESLLTREQAPVCQSDMQTIFLPNFYILGIINYFKNSANNLRNLDNLSFVSAAPSKLAIQPVLPSPSERCCFATCNKQATLFCPSCEGIYCQECCTVVHKSAKNLMAHEPVLRRSTKYSLSLENCDLHPEMQVEFFCKTCELSSCCYCVLDKHSDHERTTLFKLEPYEMEEFKKLQKDAEMTLRQILSAQKKAARMVNFDAGSVKKKISQQFANLHGKLQAVEQNLCDELEGFKTNHKGLDNIQSSLMSSAELVKSLVAFDEDKIGDKKLNLRGALEKLRTLENLPIFLLNQNGQSEPVSFVIKREALAKLEENYVIEKCDESEFRLVTKNELPENYVIESDTEVDVELSTLIKDINIDDYTIKSAPIKNARQPSSGDTSESKNALKSKAKAQRRKQLGKDTQRIDILHINSMYSFYIQYRYQQANLRQLNEEIENYIKMDGTQTVKDPELNELYLASYKHGHQKVEKWYRARLLGITNTEKGPTFEVFFIDLGITEMVDCKRLTAIPSILAKQPPMAIECALHNPMEVYWNKTAHYSLSKIVKGKETYMLEKSYRNGIHEVDLMIASSDGGHTSVIDMLVHAHDSVDPASEDGMSFNGSVVSRKEIVSPFLKVYSNNREFTKNQTEKVIIANVIDPDNIFVHMANNIEIYKQMNSAIRKYYKAATTKSCFPIEGAYVIVEYRDSIRSNWHRAFIKNVDLKANKVYVMLVDWGLNVSVSTAKIRPIIEEFTKLETQVVLIKLAHVVPYNKQVNWSHLASSFLQGYQNSQEELKMIVQDPMPKVEVALFEISSNVDICINTMLVDNNYADSIGPISTTLEWLQYEAPDPEFPKQEGFMSSLLEKVCNEADEESDSEDLCYVGVKKRRVDVIKVEGPNLIWVKFEDLKNKERELIKGLHIHYSQEKSRKDKWEIGDKCVSEDENAYVRGTVLEQISEDSYKICLYDKVKEITTTVDKIYVLNKYLARYPQVAFKAHLAYVKPAGDTGEWSRSAVEALQEIFNKHKRIYAIKGQEKEEDLLRQSIPLDMWYGLVIRGGPLDPDRVKYVSIHYSLVKLGFAFKIPRPVTPKTTISVTAEVHEVKTAYTGDDLIRSLINISESQKAVETVATDEILVDEVTSKAENKNAISQEKPAVDGSVGAKPKLVLPYDAKSGNLSPSKETDVIEISQENEAIENIADPNTNTIKKYSDQESWNAIIEDEMEKPKIESNSDNTDEDSSNSSPYHKSEMSIDDWMPAYRLKNQDFMARVTCAESGGYLYLHDECLHKVYIEMESNIKEYFDTNPPVCTDNEWESGQLCTIKFTDGNWYRGKILQIINPQLISVFMIDFGSDHDVSPDVLFREVLYVDLGAFATRVKLDQVYSRSNKWLTSDYDHLIDLLTDWCRIVVKGPLDVEVPLVDVYNEHNVFVNRKLAELCPNLSMCSNFPIETEEEEDDSIVIESVDCANEFLMQRFEESINPLEHHYNTHGLDYRVRPVLQELLEGEQVLMEIGGILNYDRILFHLPDNDVSEVIYNLIVDIQDIVDKLPPLTTFTVGTPCVAPFSEDNVWYRAKIIGIKSTGEDLFNVLFVDYGNSETVSAKDLKIIPNNYLELPQQTWEASLNVTLEKTDDLNSVMPVIKALDKTQKFVKLVNGDPLVVDLFDKDGKLCYANLLDNGSLKQTM